MRSMVFFQFLSLVLNVFLNGKTRVKLAFKTGLTNAIFFAMEFWRIEIFIPMLKGFPGNERLILMSELNELVKYSGLIGSKLFFAVLSEMKFTFDEKLQNGFDFGAFRWDH